MLWCYVNWPVFWKTRLEAMCRTDWTEGVCSQEDELHVIAIVYARDYESQNEGGVGEQGMVQRLRDTTWKKK